MNPETERWLAQAEHDLANAQKTCNMGIWDLCTFPTQQAAGKSLKALLLERTGNPPPRAHSIQKLADLAGLRASLPQEALDLDDYYVSVRYPDAVVGLPYQSLGKLQAEAALDAARAVMDLVQKELGISI